MISLITKEICNIDNFHELCTIFLYEHYYNELAENMQVAFCILKYEMDILRQSNHEEIVHALREKSFFDDTEKKMLLGTNKIEVIMNILKNKSLHYFKTFLFCLKKLVSCSEIVKDIEREIANLNYNLFLKISQFSAEELTIVNTYANCVPLHDFQQYFIHLYSRPSFKIIDVFHLDAPKIFYVNLALITVDNEEPDFHIYDSLLFRQEITYSKTLITSLSEIFIENQRVVLIQGSPGSGKTTLAKKVCIDWVEGKLAQNFGLIILIELRDTRVAEVTSLRALVALYMGNTLSESITKEITRIKGKGSLFLLDGWDELPEKCHLSSLYTELISGNLLPDATIVITSHPSATGSLPYKHVHPRIEILGFTEEQVEEYITKYFQDHDNPQIAQHVLSQLTKSPILKRLVYVPVNLIIILNIVKQSNEQIPQSYTALYVTFLLLLLNRYQEKNYDFAKIRSLDHLPDCIAKMLHKLGEMAYYELLCDRMTFTEEVLQKYSICSNNIPEDFDGMGLLHVKNGIYSTHVSKTYQFIHRTLQELLAAWYLSQQSIAFQHKELIYLFGQMRLGMIWIFYGGLTKFEKITFDTLLHKSIKQYKTFKSYTWGNFIYFISTTVISNRFPVKEILSIYFSAEQYSNDISKHVPREFQTTLIAVAKEVEDPSLCKIICNSYLFNGTTCWLTVPDCAVTPQILLALSYCISHSEKKWILYCKTLNTEGAGILLQHLTCNIKDCDHKTCHHHNCIRMLNVYSSPDQIDGLVRIICHQNSLEYIVLSQSISCDDSCIVKLAEALRHNTCIKIIHLLSCFLTKAGILALADMLQFNSTLEWIALRDNRVTLEDVILLMDSIYHHNSTLHMLALDNEFHKISKVQSCLKKINNKRYHDNKQELSLGMIDCVRFGSIAKRFLTLR